MIPGLDFEKFARSMVTRAEINTAYGPSFVIEKPFQEGPPNPYLAKLQPQIKLTLIDGRVIDMAPYGAPPPTQWPKITTAAKVTGALAGAGLVLWVASKLVR